MLDIVIVNIVYELICIICIYFKEQVMLFFFFEFFLYLVYYFQVLSFIEGFDIYNYEIGNNFIYSFFF